MCSSITVTDNRKETKNQVDRKHTGLCRFLQNWSREESNIDNYVLIPRTVCWHKHNGKIESIWAHASSNDVAVATTFSKNKQMADANTAAALRG